MFSSCLSICGCVYLVEVFSSRLADDFWFRVVMCRRSLPADAYEQLKRRLCDLLQRNREFRALLLAGDVRPTPIGGLTFGTLATDEPLDAFPSPGKFFDMV